MGFTGGSHLYPWAAHSEGFTTWKRWHRWVLGMLSTVTQHRMTLNKVLCFVVLIIVWISPLFAKGYVFTNSNKPPKTKSFNSEGSLHTHAPGEVGQQEPHWQQRSEGERSTAPIPQTWRGRPSSLPGFTPSRCLKNRNQLSQAGRLTQRTAFPSRGRSPVFQTDPRPNNNSFGEQLILKRFHIRLCAQGGGRREGVSHSDWGSGYIISFLQTSSLCGIRSWVC